MIHVAPKQTWTFGPNDVIAPNNVDATVGSDALAAMNFDGVILDDDSIDSVELVTVADIDDQDEPIISESEVADDKRTVKLEISFLSATAGTYTVSVEVLTLREFKYVRKGRLVLA